MLPGFMKNARGIKQWRNHHCLSPLSANCFFFYHRLFHEDKMSQLNGRFFFFFNLLNWIFPALFPLKPFQKEERSVSVSVC